METTNRRYDIDWLRVITIGLLLIYHIAIAFQPWGVFIGFIQSPKPIEWIWTPMSMLNVWRIPLLFFVSGMGVSFAMRKRNWKQLVFERTQRILIPFIFGVIFIVPLHFFLLQSYYDKEISYLPNSGHLWFLKNIYIYVILLTPLFYLMLKKENTKIIQNIKKLFGNPLSLLLIIGVFIAEALIMNPDIFTFYAISKHGFIMGFIAFLFGFCIVFSGNSFWEMLLKWRWIFLILGIALYTNRLIQFDLKGPNYLLAIESNIWIFAVFAFGYKYLNRPSKILNYLSQGAYPIYILHMVFLYLASSIIFPTNLSAGMKFILVVFFTFAACLLSYHLVIKQTKVLRFVFGLKIKRSTNPL